MRFKRMSTSCEIALGWMPQNSFQANNGLCSGYGAERQQASNHCWAGSLSARYTTRPQYGVTMPQWLNIPFPVPVIYSTLTGSKAGDMQHLMMTSSNGIISELLGLCAGKSLVTGEITSQRPVTRSFGVFFDLRLNKRLNKQSRRWQFETPSRP